MSWVPGGQRIFVEHESPASCSSSSIGLEPITLPAMMPHSQTWTLVPEFSMSLRQQKAADPFECWKYDVQSQMTNIAKKLEESLEQYPDLSSRCLNTDMRSPLIGPDFDRRKPEYIKRQTGTVANSLVYGLGRI